MYITVVKVPSVAFLQWGFSPILVSSLPLYFVLHHLVLPLCRIEPAAKVPVSSLGAAVVQHKWATHTTKHGSQPSKFKSLTGWKGHTSTLFLLGITLSNTKLSEYTFGGNMENSIIITI